MNMNTKEKDLKYIMHTYGRYDVALKKGKGVTCIGCPDADTDPPSGSAGTGIC